MPERRGWAGEHHPAHRPAGGGLAKGTWLPFEKGNVAALRHGATPRVFPPGEAREVALEVLGPEPSAYGLRPEGDDGAAVTTVLDRMAVWSGTRAQPVSLDLVESWVTQASRDHGAKVISDPYQAAQLLERLRARGIRAEEFAFTSTSVGRLASGLFLAIRDGALELPDDADLLDELANVRLVETSPGLFRLGRGTHYVPV